MIICLRKMVTPMTELTDRDWKGFGAFGPKGLFEIHTTNSSIDKKRLVLDGPEIVPYVTRSADNNGVALFVSDKNYSYGFDLPDVITVGLDTQTAFYQPYKFVTGQNIQIITGEHLTPLVIQFLLPLLRTQMTAKFNWGGNGATLSRMKRLRLMLPIDDNGQPDYDFMSDYVRERLSQKRQSYLDYVHDRLAELGTVQSLPAINSVDWTPFALPKLFEFERGREKNMKKLVSGAVPLVSAKKINNGVKAFVGNPHKIITSGNTVTLNNDGDGGAGLAYYQPSDFALDTHVTALHAKQKVSSYALQFIAASLSKQHELFGHGRSISLPRAKHLKVMLPTMSDGTPDYSYMDQYVKNKMNQKYNHYLKYLNASVIGSNKL